MNRPFIAPCRSRCRSSKPPIALARRPGRKARTARPGAPAEPARRTRSDSDHRTMRRPSPRRGKTVFRKCPRDRACWKPEELPSSQTTGHFFVLGNITAAPEPVDPGSAVSPVLANLFMHYAFDMWLEREFPTVAFERYADDQDGKHQSSYGHTELPSLGTRSGRVSRRTSGAGGSCPSSLRSARTP